MNVQEKYQRLEDTVRRYNPGANFELIRSAFRFAEEHHRGQNRKDGSPFITHPLAVAQIVAEELHLDSESIAAALLHDVVEDTPTTLTDLTAEGQLIQAESFQFYIPADWETVELNDEEIAEAQPAAADVDAEDETPADEKTSEEFWAQDESQLKLDPPPAPAAEDEAAAPDYAAFKGVKFSE